VRALAFPGKVSAELDEACGEPRIISHDQGEFAHAGTAFDITEVVKLVGEAWGCHT